MKRRTGLLAVLVTVAVLLAAAGPVAGQPPDATTVSGHACAYVTVPGEVLMTGQVMHIKDQVFVADFVSDDPTVLASGTETSVLNVSINFMTMTGKFHRTLSLSPDGADGTFEGIAVGWFRFDPATGIPTTHVSGTLHGTGEFEGLTMVLEYGAGDPSRCRPDVWDTASMSGFIVPPGK